MSENLLMMSKQDKKSHSKTITVIQTNSLDVILRRFFFMLYLYINIQIKSVVQMYFFQKKRNIFPSDFQALADRKPESQLGENGILTRGQITFRCLAHKLLGSVMLRLLPAL